MIRVPAVRLIGPNGEALGVLPTQRALAHAQDLGYDLVEIAPNATPPVAKILDFGKYRFEKQQEAKEAKKRQKSVIWKEIRVSPKIDDHDIETATPPVAKILDFGKYRFEKQQEAKEAKKRQKSVTWKEIRVSPKIDDHDIETKIKSASKFLGEGDKLKVTVRFRGRELAHPDRGRVLLMQIAERLKEHGTVERSPLLEGRSMSMIMNPLRGLGATPAAPQTGATQATPAMPRPAAAATPRPAAGPGPRPAASPPGTRPAPGLPRTPAAAPAPGATPAPRASAAEARTAAPRATPTRPQRSN